MTFSKTKLFGFLALSCSLIACGQTQASTAPNATPSDTPSVIAQTTTAPQTTASPVAVAKSPKPQSSAMASTEAVTKTKQFVDCDNDGKVDDEWRDLNGTMTCVRNAKNPDESLAEIEPAIFPKEEIDEDAHKQFEKLANQPCDRQTKDEKSVRYSICTVKGADGKPRIISASATSTVPDLSGDGTGYWFAEDGTVAAIRYFHSGELFVFSGDRLLAELIQAQKVVVNGEEKFQKRTANRDFTEQQRKRLEDAAKDGGKNILSKFK
jgi:hypothetical protein